MRTAQLRNRACKKLRLIGRRTGYLVIMNVFRLSRKLRSTLLVDGLALWAWRHRDEVRTWGRSFPSLVRGARSGRGVKVLKDTFTETRSLAAQARSVDRQRLVNQGNRSRVVDKVSALRRRTKKTEELTPE